MQKVSELKYERLSMEEFAQEIKEVIHQVKTADSARAVLAARDRCNQLMIRWETAQLKRHGAHNISHNPLLWLIQINDIAALFFIAAAGREEATITPLLV